MSGGEGYTAATFWIDDSTGEVVFIYRQHHNILPDFDCLYPGYHYDPDVDACEEYRWSDEEYLHYNAVGGMFATGVDDFDSESFEFA